MDCTIIKEAISPKTLSKFTFALTLFWIVVGAVLCGAFSEIEISEPRYDFRFDGTDDIDKDFLRGKCYDQYRLHNHKRGIAPYAFTLINVSLILFVTCIYSLCVKSKVDKLERSYQDDDTEPRDKRRSLFIAYVCHLLVNFALEITFFVLLETNIFYPKNFPSDFSCSIKNLSVKITESTNLFNCNTTRADEKNVWITAAEVINGVLAFCAFVEIICILSRARNGKRFMENRQFYLDHLKSTSGAQRQGQPETIPLVEPQHRASNLRSALKTLKKNCLLGTEQESNLQQPFLRPKLGEKGHIHDLRMDEIYVHAAIHEGRAYHDFPKDRWEQLKQYPPNAKDCTIEKPEDIIDNEHKNVLVVGRPGIGKTSLSTHILRLWALGKAFIANFKVVFLVKFRRLNDIAELSLRDLLACAETVQRLDHAVWKLVQEKSSKVLLIFDGLDEYSRKEDIIAQNDGPTYHSDVEKKMPVYALYNKLTAGELLRGASILTTTRPTAVTYVEHVNFQRIVEIRGFTSKNVEDYVQRFSHDVPGAKEKIWEHIKSNTNIFSLCYIPVNCFLICHCLLQIYLSGSSQQLPTKITDIYQMIVKMVFFNHNRESWPPEKLEKLKRTHMYEPFENFPEELQKIFNSLGEIAFKGIQEGRLLFESSEVKEFEDCGLLHKLPDVRLQQALNDPPKSQFCFTHLTVQEFFAAKYLVDTESSEKTGEFVHNHINDGRWQVVLQFVAGLLKSSSDIFIKLLPELTKKKETPESSEPKTLTSWPATRKDQDLAVQVCKCLYEINDEQQPVLQNKIEKIKFNAVEFSDCSLAPIDVGAVLHFLENAEEVLDIKLSHNELGDLGANEVKKFIVNRERKLKWLDLSYNKLTENAAKDLGEALKHSNCKLESLALTSNKLTDNAVKDLGEALKHSNCKLESLDLSDNKLTDNAAKDLGEALKHSNCKLESLHLSYNKLTDKVAKDLGEALKHSNCKLESLDLGYNKLTDNAAKDLGEALKHSNCKLETLRLTSNKLTDNAAKDLGEALKHSNCKLESLYLGYNKLTDNAAKDLGEALKHSNCKLESLYLTRNKLTDNAAKDLGEALKHSNCKLKRLLISNRNFTKAGKKYLTNAGRQSNCQVDLV